MVLARVPFSGQQTFKKHLLSLFELIHGSLDLCQSQLGVVRKRVFKSKFSEANLHSLVTFLMGTW